MFAAMRDPGCDGNSRFPLVAEAPTVPSWGDVPGGQLPSPCQPPCKGGTGDL